MDRTANSAIEQAKLEVVRTQSKRDSARERFQRAREECSNLDVAGVEGITTLRASRTELAAATNDFEHAFKRWIKLIVS